MEKRCFRLGGPVQLHAGPSVPRTLGGAARPIDVHGPYAASAIRRRRRRHRLQLLQQRLAAGAAAVLQGVVRPYGG